MLDKSSFRKRELFSQMALPTCFCHFTSPQTASTTDGRPMNAANVEFYMQDMIRNSLLYIFKAEKPTFRRRAKQKQNITADANSCFKLFGILSESPSQY